MELKKILKHIFDHVPNENMKINFCILVVDVMDIACCSCI